MNWYCVQTKPSKEAFASRYCSEVLGLHTYFPVIKQRRVIRRLKRVVESPLFPGYIFCRLDPAIHLRAVKYGPDIASIVQYGGLPTVLPDSLVEDLRTWTTRYSLIAEAQPSVHPGEIVLVTTGLMSGLEAVFLHEMDDRERVEVLLLVLNCGARMVVKRDEIRKVS